MVILRFVNDNSWVVFGNCLMCMLCVWKGVKLCGESFMYGNVVKNKCRRKVLIVVNLLGYF